MRSLELALDGGWRVLYTALLFGAGLPVIYAVAMRLLTVGSTTTTDAAGKTHTQFSPLGRLLSWLLLALIVAGVLVGIAIIAASGFGKVVSFDGGFPSIVDK